MDTHITLPFFYTFPHTSISPMFAVRSGRIVLSNKEIKKLELGAHFSGPFAVIKAVTKEKVNLYLNK